MNEITYPLNPNTRGANVAHLQDALVQLVKDGRMFQGDEVLRQSLSLALRLERTMQSYGEVTRRLVSVFQTFSGLKPTGNIDQQTADAINELLRNLGLLPKDRVEEPIDAPDPDFVDDLDDPLPFVVRGRVIDHDGLGLARLTLVVVDKNIGGDVTLGKGVSTDLGTYEILYTPTRLPNGKDKPDIQVYVVSESRQMDILASSVVRYNATEEENDVDIFVDQSSLPEMSEYGHVTSELAPLIGAESDQDIVSRLARLEENESRQDITYLANKTGWDARMVAMTSLASQFSQNDGIEAELYYALFRAGVPANESALAQISPEQVHMLWERAIRDNMVSDALQKVLPDRLERFVKKRMSGLLDLPTATGVSNLKELLSTSLTDESSHQKFAQLYYENRDHPDVFWKHVHEHFPKEADKLQLDAKLASLTINNAPLIARLHAEQPHMLTPVDLVRKRFYNKDEWIKLLGDKVEIPPEIPGDDSEEKRDHYAALMASHIRLSYPTAVVTHMVETDVITLRTTDQVKRGVVHFLSEHQGNFELGVHPVEQYVTKNGIKLDGAVLDEVKRVQRTYQISPSDEVLGRLLARDLDSAHAIVRYDEQSFVDHFHEELGGEMTARMTYAKAHQVHHTVLNIASSYLLARSELSVDAIHNTLPALDEVEREKEGILAYPTLEQLFGQMEYCACEHCRSWLSPAAYLVDMLQFLDPPTFDKENPLDVLLSRRPDIQHTPLTCENTNTVIPYIDLVNEVLEHFVIHGSLDDFVGFNNEGDQTPEELIANPQFVNDAAYHILKQSIFPLSLPFDQDLEALRQYFNLAKMPLQKAMQLLRKNDELDRDAGAEDGVYGYVDVLMERLHISRAEYNLLTRSEISLNRLYGEDDSASKDDFIRHLSGVRQLTRTIGLTYEQLIDLTRTQFINPHSHLLSKVEKLGINFATIGAFVKGTLTESQLNEMLPSDIDTDAYDGNVAQWLADHQQRIMDLIILADPTDHNGTAGFGDWELTYAGGDLGPTHNRLRPIEFHKILRFIKVWRKLGWSIEQTDEAFTALYPAESMPVSSDNENEAQQKLDDGVERFLVRLSHVDRIIKELGLKVDRDLTSLLSCWSPIDTNDDGNLLTDSDQTVAGQSEALRAAFKLTDDEWTLITDFLGFDAQTALTIDNVSSIFRYGYVARAFSMSVRGLLALIDLADLDPFQPLDGAFPPFIKLMDLRHAVDRFSLKINELLYDLQHIDPSGQATPGLEEVLSFAKTLRDEFDLIDQQYDLQEDPDLDFSEEHVKADGLVRTLSTHIPADIDVVRCVLTDADVVHALDVPDRPACDDFIALKLRGLTASFFFAEDVTGPADLIEDVVNGVDYRDGRMTFPERPDSGDGPLSCVWDGFVEPPGNGQYTFEIEADPGAGIELVIDDKKIDLRHVNGVWHNEIGLSLKAARPIKIRLTAQRVDKRLVLRWHSRGMGRLIIPAANLYPLAVIHRFKEAYVRVLKVVSLARRLNITADELAHFATDQERLIDGESWLNAIPVTTSMTGETHRVLFQHVLHVARYKSLQDQLDVKDARLLHVLQNAQKTTENGRLLADVIIGWKDTDRLALLEHFGLGINDLSNVDHLTRLLEAYDVVKMFRIGAETLLANTTNNPTADNARAIRIALNARHDPLTWQEVIKPVHDSLRRLRRDALVAYVLNQLRLDETTAHIDTPDKLYEYFLIDVQMDPCMPTSRIKQAIGSVQLFVQRCLLNLEPRVASTSIHAKQWDWMKRYRVWEANRKVFLWPENWLEPELRDNKSPFFRELEGELLQSDLTDDAAASALVRYLEKLDGVAHLEVCGMYVEENEANNVADDITHVIARTAGTRKTYYYRRLQHSAWTPWEEVDLNIEGDAVIPVVWKGRLLLFWTAVTQSSPMGQNASITKSDRPLSQIKGSELTTDVNVQVGVALYWSEYYNGKWQASRSSDMNKPLPLSIFPSVGAGAFDPGRLTLSSHDGSDALKIRVHYPGVLSPYFELFNTQSVPVQHEVSIHMLPFMYVFFPPTSSRIFTEGKNPFTISYVTESGGNQTKSDSKKVLMKGSLYKVIAPHHPLTNTYTAPFFFQDHRHLFFVTSTMKPALVDSHIDFGSWIIPPVITWDIPPPVLAVPDFPVPQPPWTVGSGIVGGGVKDPRAADFHLDRNPYINRALDMAQSIQFGQTMIGFGGSTTIRGGR